MSFTLVKNELILTITKDKLACILSIQKVKFDAKVLHFFELCKSWHHFFTLKMHYFAKIKTLECIILQNTTFQNALFDNPNWNFLAKNTNKFDFYRQILAQLKKKQYLCRRF